MGLLFSKFYAPQRRSEYNAIRSRSQSLNSSNNTGSSSSSLKVLNEFLLLQTKWFEATSYNEKINLLNKFLQKTERFVNNSNSNVQFAYTDNNTYNASYKNTSYEQEKVAKEFEKRYSLIRDNYNESGDDENMFNMMNMYNRIVPFLTETRNIYETFDKRESAILTRNTVLHLGQYYLQYVNYLEYCDGKEKKRKWENFLNSFTDSVAIYDDIDAFKRVVQNYKEQDIAQLYKDTTGRDIFEDHNIITNIRTTKKQQQGGKRNNNKKIIKKPSTTKATSKLPQKRTTTKKRRPEKATKAKKKTTTKAKK